MLERKEEEEEQEVIDKGREFHKVMHDGRNDRRKVTVPFAN